MNFGTAIDILQVSWIAGIGLRIGWNFPYALCEILIGFVRGFKRTYNNKDDSK